MFVIRGRSPGRHGDDIDVTPRLQSTQNGRTMQVDAYNVVPQRVMNAVDEPPGLNLHSEAL